MCPGYPRPMEFRRITDLPPYVFTIIDGLKIEARRAGADVIDLGFGNPDIPSPAIAVDKLAEAAHNTRNHRYSPSKGIPKLREAVAASVPAPLRRRARSRDRDHQHDRREGRLQPPDVGAARARRRRRGAEPVVPDPHLRPAIRRCRRSERCRSAWPREDYVVENFEGRRGSTAGRKPRVIVVLSFPHNPTTDVRRPCVHAAARRLRARARGDRSSTTSRTPISASTATCRRRSCRPNGAKECAVELYSMTKSLLDGRLAHRVHGRQRRGRRSAREAEELPRLRHVPADPDRGDGDDERGADYPKRGNAIYQAAATRCATGSTASAGTFPKPKGTMFVVGADSRAVPRDGVDRVRQLLVQEAMWRSSPGIGFGPGGDDFVRFALIENEQRIHQAVRNLRRPSRNSESPSSASLPPAPARCARQSVLRAPRRRTAPPLRRPSNSAFIETP